MKDLDTELMEAFDKEQKLEEMSPSPRALFIVIAILAAILFVWRINL